MIWRSALIAKDNAINEADLNELKYDRNIG